MNMLHNIFLINPAFVPCDDIFKETVYTHTHARGDLCAGLILHTPVLRARSHLFTPLNSYNALSTSASCILSATFHTTADVSCWAVWQKFVFLLEYEQQMVRKEQEEKKKTEKGVVIDNALNHATVQRDEHFSAACLNTGSLLLEVVLFSIDVQQNIFLVAKQYTNSATTLKPEDRRSK